MSSVGRRILRLRNERNLTQRELAAPRYTAAYVSSVEAGRRMPSGDALAHFAAQLGITFQELATGRSPQAIVRLDLALAEADLLAHSDPETAASRYRAIGNDAIAREESDRLAHCHLGLGWIALHSTDVAAATLHFEEAEKLLTAAPLLARVDAIAGRAACLRYSGDIRYAVYLLASTRDELSQRGYPDPGALLTLNAHLAVCGSQLDDEHLARAASATALALVGYHDQGEIAQMYVTVARTLLGEDRPAEACMALLQAREALRHKQLSHELGWCHRARGRARAEDGDLAGAAADLAESQRLLTKHRQLDHASAVGIELAQVERRRGRLDAAAALLRSAQAHPRLNGVIQRELGLLATAEGDADRAEAELRGAINLLRASGPRRELAQAVAALADLLLSQGRKDEAATAMRDGLAGVEDLAMRLRRVGPEQSHPA